MVEKLVALEPRRLGWRVAALPFAVALLLVVVVVVGFSAVAGLVAEHSVGSVAAGTVVAFSQIAAAAVADLFEPRWVGLEGLVAQFDFGQMGLGSFWDSHHRISFRHLAAAVPEPATLEH